MAGRVGLFDGVGLFEGHSTIGSASCIIGARVRGAIGDGSRLLRIGPLRLADPAGEFGFHQARTLGELATAGGDACGVEAEGGQ